MKPICLLFVLPLLGTGCRTEQSAYLEKALSQLERIERVAYRRSSESYLPGDTIPRRYLRYYVEQRNRADTTLRHSYLSYYNADDTTRIDGGYDGTIAVDLDHDRREVVIDDFSIPRAPYRLTDMTFFCRAEAILRYVLTTSDPIRTEFTPCGDGYRLRLDIDRDCVVEFWGRPYYNRPPRELFLEAEHSAYEIVFDSERMPRYVAHETDRSFRWIDGGRRFLIMQETATGWMHLYLGEPGEPLRALTEGRWEVTAIVGADDRAVYYTSTERSPLERNLYAVDYKGRHKRLLTPDKGFHTIAPSAGMRYYISTFSSADDPGRVEICDARGRTVRTVADNAALRRLADSIRLPRKEFFTFTTERGDTLGGYIVRPAGFDPARRYPCLLTQYSGPGSQTVQNRWKLDWEDVLAQRGYVVVATDGRGTGYRGEAFKKSTYGQLGRLEVEDQLSTARYMAAQPWIDAERIGIYGWSYGGFMALSCACKGDGLFKAAVAVAPVTSWRYYDTIYSELYNGLPQENPAGYNENAPLMLAPLLRDDRTRLLLIHGTADDNVHFQNSAEMIRALTDAGKEFDLMIYPDQNHSMQPDYTRQIRQRMISFVERNL